MNRVTLNGKPPIRRMNLLKDTTIFFKQYCELFKSYDPIQTFIAEGEKYIIIGKMLGFGVYKINKNNEFTNLFYTNLKEHQNYIYADNNQTILENGHVLFISSNLSGAISYSKKILKYDYKKNELTVIKPSIDLYKYIYWMHKIKNEYYFSCGDDGGNIIVYKTSDLVEFTDITNSIIKKNNSNINSFKDINTVCLNNKIYFSNGHIFDGITLDIFNDTFKNNSQDFLEKASKESQGNIKNKYNIYGEDAFYTIRTYNGTNSDNKFYNIYVYEVTEQGIIKIQESRAEQGMENILFFDKKGILDFVARYKWYQMANIYREI